MGRKQVIKYQTTDISPDRSAREIQKLCQKYGATSFQLGWREGKLASIRFTIPTPGGEELPVLLKAQTDTIYKILRDDRTGYVGYELEKKLKVQAERIAWRHLKGYTEQSLLAAHIGLKSKLAVFMADLETQDGITLAENLLKEAENAGGVGQLLQLKPGGPE